MTSRERVLAALGHEVADRVPLDLGASNVSGMHVNAVYALRQSLGLDAPETPVKVIDPSQMLGEVKPDLMGALGVDAVGLRAPGNKFGFPNADWKEWTNFQGTPVLVPGAFNSDPEPDGSLYQYPHNDRSAPPSGHMPKDGFYFDVIVRQDPIDESKLDPADNCEEFGPLSEETIAYFAAEAARLRATDKAIVFSPGGMGFGDIANVPAPQLKHPKGIRDLEEWYMSSLIRPEYVYAVFERQCEIALRNLERLLPHVGDQVDVLYVTGTDFGTQRGPFIAPETYRQLFQPFHKRINDWVHTHTSWKTFIHSCGSVWQLIPDFIEAGFDILNPVQCSAADMEPQRLKDTFGELVTFWGGGVDTQKTLPFGTPGEVRAEVRERLEIFSRGGGFVFNTIHNVQSGTPVENMLALYETVREFRCSG